MDAAHRRIELQSPADLTYLVANVKRAARQKIDLHLPPSAAPEGGEDVLRRRVEELVDEYIRNTFASARHNITINGMEPKEVEEEEKEEASEEYEPFDTRLADKIRTLESQKATLTEKVADQRRTAPSLAARAWESAFLAESDALERQLQERSDAALRDAAAAKLELGVLPALDEGERGEDVRRMWEEGTRGLVELKVGLTGTVARLERAERAGAYLEGR